MLQRTPLSGKRPRSSDVLTRGSESSKKRKDAQKRLDFGANGAAAEEGERGVVLAFVMSSAGKSKSDCAWRLEDRYQAKFSRAGHVPNLAPKGFWYATLTQGPSTAGPATPTPQS